MATYSSILAWKIPWTSYSPGISELNMASWPSMHALLLIAGVMSGEAFSVTGLQFSQCKKRGYTA